VKLGELLDPRRVVIPLKARDVREATSALAKTMVDTGVVADRAAFEKLLREDWPEDIVSVGGRAFFPHFRTNAVNRVALALGVTGQPITRPGEPGPAARVVVLIVAPLAAASAYLRAMSAVASALASDETLAALHGAAGPDDVTRSGRLADSDLPAEVTVADIMTAGVTAVGPDLPLREAAQTMLSRGVRALPVVGGEQEVLGMLTDGHLLNFLLPATVSELSTGQLKVGRRKGRAKAATGADPGDTPVRDVMDRSVLCLSEDQSVADAAALMLAREVDRFPVTRDGVLVGFLTRGDIVRKLLGT
jgi:CBS domain-containing protein